MTTNGSLTPPLAAKIVWGFLMSAIAAVLLAAGGLEALQTASLVKILRKEPIPLRPADVRHFKRHEKAVKEEKE